MSYMIFGVRKLILDKKKVENVIEPFYLTAKYKTTSDMY